MTPTAFQKTDTEGAARRPRISCDRQRWRLATPVYQSTSNQNLTLLQLVVLVVPGSGTSECATNTDFLSLKLGKMAKGHKLPQRSHSSILDRPRGIVPLCLRSPQGSPSHSVISAAPTIRRKRTSFFLWILLFCLAPPQKDPSRTSGHAEDGTTPPKVSTGLTSDRVHGARMSCVIGRVPATDSARLARRARSRSCFFFIVLGLKSEAS